MQRIQRHFRLQRKQFLHRFPINNNNQSSSGKAEAEYILHWLCILGDRPTKFERAIARNRHHLSDPIALFAIVCHRSTVIKAAHGFNTIIMQDEDHAANRRIGFFLGGRIAAANEHGGHLQNLPLCTTHDWNTLLTNYTSSPAPKHTICNSNDVFLPPTNPGKCHTTPWLFPLPHTWWPAFLDKPLTVLDAFNYIEDITQQWTSPKVKAAAQAA